MSPEQSLPAPEHGRVYLHGHAPATGGRSSRRVLTIALSVKAQDYPQRFFWARDNAFALEYTPDPLSPERARQHTSPFTRDGIPVRFHFRFGDYELGDADAVKASAALAVHTRVIDEVAGLGEPVITVHLNLNKDIPFNIQRGIENLTRLVDHAGARGMTVCLENLRLGPASDPANVLAWAKASGAMITLDIGHAVSSACVQGGKYTVPGIVALFGKWLHEAHVYGRETDRHYPIEDMTPYKPVIDGLLATGCAWWTVELESLEEALATRRRLIEYLAEQHKC
ncbi:sugar phosphate isomerase/epimerase family protein [Chloroflexota bacterium]